MHQYLSFQKALNNLSGVKIDGLQRLGKDRKNEKENFNVFIEIDY